MLSKGVTWDWETFPEYMDAAAAAAAESTWASSPPLTPFRHYVMGEESMERAATAEETAKITALIAEAVAAGRAGLYRTTIGRQHIGYKGRPLACRNASRDEFKAYCQRAARIGQRRDGNRADQNPSAISPTSEYESAGFPADRKRRPVTWLAILNRDDMPEAASETLSKAEPLIRRGGIPQVTCRPLIIQINLRESVYFRQSRRWNPVFNQPAESAEEDLSRSEIPPAPSARR